jgi:hypothetical protein
MDMDSQWLMLLCLLGFVLFLSVKVSHTGKHRYIVAWQVRQLAFFGF